MYKKLKKILDFYIAFIGLILLSPLFIVIMILIKTESKGPVFFKQKRIGINKKYFYILKFRTMKINTPQNTPTHMLKNPNKYITKVGKFLRKTSMDELPQLINILKGEMSVIGPRPALWNQHDLIKERDKYGANDVLPGLTGWAQINGRDELPITLKAAYDGQYVKKMSFWFDCKCFMKTIVSVIKKEGIKEGKENNKTA